MVRVGTKKQKVSRYVALFFISMFFTLASLVWDTVKTTTKEVWQEEGRAYNTMWEDAIAVAVGYNEIKLLKNGYSLNGFPVSLLDAINRSQYNRAISKIPANDLERVYWYHGSIFLPHSYDTRSVAQESSETILATIIEQLANIDKYTHASKVVYDASMHLIIVHYATYFFEVAKAENLEKNRKSVLRALHYSSITLDPEAIVSYKRPNVTKIVFNSLTSAYFLLGNNIIFNKTCDPEVAQWWIQASQKSYDVLLKNPAVAAKYLVPDVGYKEFSEEYYKKTPLLLRIIKQKCSGNSKGSET
jgi:hypothetical protein